jgi:transposase
MALRARRTFASMESARRADRRKLAHRPAAVADAAFLDSRFFHADDVVQLKYEMLRRHRVDGVPIAEVAARFGVSRQTFYNVARAFDAEGIVGLLPGKSGPRNGWKCTGEVLRFAEERRREEPRLGWRALAALVAQGYGLVLHPNTLRHALVKKSAEGANRRA